MTFVDKVIAAVTPPESDRARARARAQARSLATSGSWFELILNQHQDIEAGFAAVRKATLPGARRLAQKQLAEILTGHSLAEEVVLYPAMALHDEKTASEMAYVEQSATKVQLAALDDLDPMSQDYLDKLEHIQGAVAHHMYQEEGTWFPKLHQKCDRNQQIRLTKKYQEEFTRYVTGQVAEAALV